MQLWAMEWLDAQEKELQELSALLVEYLALLQFSLERLYYEIMQDPPKSLNQPKCEAFHYLPGMVNINRGAASKTGQVPATNCKMGYL